VPYTLTDLKDISLELFKEHLQELDAVNQLPIPVKRNIVVHARNLPHEREELVRMKVKTLDDERESRYVKQTSVPIVVESARPSMQVSAATM